MITVQDHLSVSELSNPGEPLHGAEFVYVNEGVDAFHANKCFATTGSLMFTSTNNRMVAVTCRHPLEQVDTCYTLIDNEVVKLGKEMPQPNNKMEKPDDDIAVVLIEEVTPRLFMKSVKNFSLIILDILLQPKYLFKILKCAILFTKEGQQLGLQPVLSKKLKLQYMIKNLLYQVP